MFIGLWFIAMADPGFQSKLTNTTVVQYFPAALTISQNLIMKKVPLLIQSVLPDQSIAKQCTQYP